MFESLVKPQPLDNDVAVMRIIHLLGQLTPNDIQYVLQIVTEVNKAVGDPEPTMEDIKNGNYRFT